MNENKNINRLKNELENRHTIPDSEEVWHRLESKLDSKKRKRRMLFSSIAIVFLFSTYTIISRQNPTSQETVVMVNKTLNTDTKHEHTENKESYHSDITTDQKNQTPISADPEKTPQANRTRINLPNYLGESLKNPNKEDSYRKIIAENNKETTIDKHFEAIDIKIADNSENPKKSILDPANSNEKQGNIKSEDDIPNLNPEDSSKVQKHLADTATEKPDSSSGKTKRYLLRPYLGWVFNQLKPFTVPGKMEAQSLFSHYAAGVYLDRIINDRTRISLNLGFMKMPSKIEFLKKEPNGNNKIIKVLNNNNFVLGIELSKIDIRRHISYHFGPQVSISGSRYNFIEESPPGEQDYFKQKELPEPIHNNYFARIDLMFNAGISYRIKRSSFRLIYHQGLIDISRHTKLFNPHTFVQLGFGYELLWF